MRVVLVILALLGVNFLVQTVLGLHWLVAAAVASVLMVVVLSPERR